MNHTQIGGTSAKASGLHAALSLNAKGFEAVSVSSSEIEAESQSLAANIETLAMRIGSLNQRLLPVLANTGSGVNGSGEAAQLSPSSPLGSELRAHSDRVSNMVGALDELLSRLVLA